MGLVTLLSIITMMSIMLFSSCLDIAYYFLEGDKILLDSTVGFVDGGNFSYWRVGYKGPLHIEVQSIVGDADIYVSDKPRPTAEIIGNNMSSTTCGIDVIHIPSDFPRPIGIGIFGHWSHEVSEYLIEVYLNNDFRDYAIERPDHRLMEIESGYDPERNIHPHVSTEPKSMAYMIWEYFWDMFKLTPTDSIYEQILHFILFLIAWYFIIRMAFFTYSVHYS